MAILAEDDGVVTRVDATSVSVRYDSGQVKDYKLIKFLRSNHTTCINQRPIVNAGQRVEKGEVIVDGPLHLQRRDRPGQEHPHGLYDLGGL